MDGQGKSDRPIVPEKGRNKSAKLADALEGRGRPKGNLRPHRRHRTPSRTLADTEDVAVRTGHTVASDLREEPGAGIPLAGICAGDWGNPNSYREQFDILS